MKKTNGRASSMAGGLVTGAVMSMGITVLVAAIGAHLVMSQYVPQEQIGYFSICALIMGTVLGALTACKKIQHRKLVVCLLSGIVYYMILLSVTALFYGGQFQGMGVTFLIVTMSSFAAVLISGREGKKIQTVKRRKV